MSTSAHAQNDVLKPYVVMILDTSGSMDIATGAGPTSCGKPDKRINHAVCAINNISNSYGDMVFSLARFRETTTGSSGNTQVTCDANGDQNGAGGDVCTTQGAYCGDCDTATGTDRACRYCTNNAGCPAGYTCDTADNTCFRSCTNNGQCTLPGEQCVNFGGGNFFCSNVCTGGDKCSQATQTCAGACKNSDNQLEILSPLVDGNNAKAAEFTNGTCNTCTTNGLGTLDPEIWGVHPSTFTPLSSALLGDKRYWQGQQATDGTQIWPPLAGVDVAGYDPINRDPNNNVFLPANCDPSAACSTNCCATQCRPYVTVLLTDGAETCTSFTNTTNSAATLLNTVPHNDAVAISSVNRSLNIVSAVTTTAHPFMVGDAIVVNGVTNATFNSAAGTFFIVTAVADATHFSYGQTAGNAASSGGTVGHRASLNKYRIETKPIGFGIAPGDPQIEGIAHAGGAADLPGVNEGYYAANEADIELAVSQILADSVRSESCNAADDDCDTRIDEDFALGVSCQAVWPPSDPIAPGQVAVGICAKTGLTQCSADHTGTVCNATPNARGSEVCNSMDDDCDGKVDEGLSCTTCIPTGETCNNKDDDCNGAQDEQCRCNAASSNSGAACVGPSDSTTCLGGGACVCTPLVRDCAITNAEGSCPGTQQCVAGAFGTCAGQTPTAEQCDGQDNNCDGLCDGFQLDCSEVQGACNPAVLGSCPAIDNPGDPSHGPILHPESGTRCDNNTDDDGDGVVNDGCPAVGPAETVCSGMADEDNDGKINDGCPTVATPLITQNVCHAGAKTCPQLCAATNSFGICSGEVKPAAADPCNALDDDCDNAIDEDFQSADCSTNCGVGKTQCVGGQITCNAAPSMSDTTCDGQDDDCDGMIDEDWVCDPSPTCVGVDCCKCGSGTTCEVNKCVNGVHTCPQMPPIEPESCNCKDDNCNGQVDEGQLCPSGSTCTNCQCAFPCAAGEFPCPIGKKCDMGFCVTDPCSGITCPPVTGHAQECIQDPNDPASHVCVNKCTQMTCTGGFICFEPTGECLPNNCTTFPDMCTTAQSCIGGTCVTNPCDGVTCDGGKYCVGGECVDSCADKQCPTGQRCRQGACETDPCGHACPFGQVCNDSNGHCIEDPCKVRICDTGQWCNPNTSECEDDPCLVNKIVCPNPDEVCRGGTCYDPSTFEVDGGNEAHVTVGGGGCNTTGNGSMGVLVALAMLGLRRRKRSSRSSGGGVGGAS